MKGKGGSAEREKDKGKQNGQGITTQCNRERARKVPSEFGVCTKKAVVTRNSGPSGGPEAPNLRGGQLGQKNVHAPRVGCHE